MMATVARVQLLTAIFMGVLGNSLQGGEETLGRIGKNEITSKYCQSFTEGPSWLFVWGAGVWKQACHLPSPAWLGVLHGGGSQPMCATHLLANCLGWDAMSMYPCAPKLQPVVRIGVERVLLAPASLKWMSKAGPRAGCKSVCMRKAIFYK